MDLLLRFKSQDLARKYKEKNFKAHLEIGYQVLLIYIILRWVLFSFLENFLQHDIFMQYWPYQPIFVAIGGVCCLMIWLLSRKLCRKGQNSWKARIGLLVPSYDVVLVFGLAVTAVSLLMNWKEEKTNSFKLHEIQGHSTILNLLLISTLAFSWVTKTAILAGVFFFHALQHSDLTTNFGRLMTIDGAISSFLVFVIVYKYEKASKKIFLEKEKSLDLSKTWNKIFNTVSEGLLVLNTEGTSSFYNKSLESIVFDSRNPDDEDCSPTFEPRKKTINLNNLAIFENISVTQYDERMRQSFLSFCSIARKEDEVYFVPIMHEMTFNFS